MKWPNFFIVGAPKAGTTSLYEYLNGTEGIFMSSFKEPKYFSRELVPDDYKFSPIRNTDEYLALFKNAKDAKAIGEATTLYLQDTLAPKLIFEKIPNAKIIIMLRDPVDRAYSHYLMMLGRGLEEKTFRESIKIQDKPEPDHDYFGAGMYFEQVKRYFGVFGKKNVKVIIFEEFISNTEIHVRDVLKFLEISSEPPKRISETFNPHSRPRNKIMKWVFNSPRLVAFGRKILPTSLNRFISYKILVKETEKQEIDVEDRKFLQKAYLENVKKLEELLGRKLPWKNFSQN